MATRNFLARVYISVTKTDLTLDGNGQPVIPAGSTENAELLKNLKTDEKKAMDDIRAMSLAHTNKSAVVKDIQQLG
jgi:hypothetical protein